jgi:hypothetical protein
MGIFLELIPGTVPGTNSQFLGTNGNLIPGNVPGTIPGMFLGTNGNVPGTMWKIIPVPVFVPGIFPLFLGIIIPKKLG